MAPQGECGTALDVESGEDRSAAAAAAFGGGEAEEEVGGRQGGLGPGRGGEGWRGREGSNSPSPSLLPVRTSPPPSEVSQGSEDSLGGSHGPRSVTGPAGEGTAAEGSGVANGMGTREDAKTNPLANRIAIRRFFV